MPDINPFPRQQQHSGYAYTDYDASPFPHGPADRPGADQTPWGDYNDPLTQIDAGFQQDFKTALARAGVDFFMVPTSIIQSLMLEAWQDTWLRQFYQSKGASGQPAPSDYTLAADGVYVPSGVSEITKELFDPHSTHNIALTSMAIPMLAESGKQLTPEQQAYGYTLGPGQNPKILDAIRQAAADNGVPYNIALAVAVAESGLSADAHNKTDREDSWGLFQLNTMGGEGQGLTHDQLTDPLFNAETALRRFKEVADADPSLRNDPGLWAVKAQGADNSNNQYATRVNNLVNSALGGAPSAVIPKPFDGNYPITLDYGQPFGGESEEGIDYGISTPGTPLYSPFAGTIELEDHGKGDWGKRVMVRLDNGFTFAIGHMSAFSVSEGERINAGVLLGESGGDPSDPSSGVSTGAHIEVQWIAPGGTFLNPHTIMDSILTGTATYRQLNLMGADAVTGGVNASPQDRVLGEDPILNAKYPEAVKLFTQYMGRPPTAAELMQVVQHGITTAQLDSYFRSLPSHIPGMSLGVYNDAKGSLDQATRSMFGHDATDGMVQDMVAAGITGGGTFAGPVTGADPNANARFWLLQQDIAGKMGPDWQKHYQQIYNASQPITYALSGNSGYDPRIAAHIYNQATGSGAQTPAPPPA